MKKSDAIRTRVVIVRNVLTDSEMASLSDLYSTIRSEETKRALRKGPLTSECNELFDHPALDGLRTTNHVSVFVHVNKRIDEELPEIYSKIVNLMHQTDKEQNWNLLSSSSNIRVMEYHEYTEGGSVADPFHADGGSLVTSSILLSSPSTFEGGEFSTMELDKVTMNYHDNMNEGDAVVFVSEKWHSVEVVESGNRQSFVTEIWPGPRCVIGRDL